MGQRLVCTVTKNEKEICKIYYHWSAYTISALYEAQKIVDCICERTNETEKDLQLRLIRFCEENGGGISGFEGGREHTYIQEMFPNCTFRQDGYSRNNGLIALSETGMQDLQDWSEGDVTIDVDAQMIYHYVFSCYDNIEEYNEERKSWDDEYCGIEYNEVPNIGYDIGEISFDDIDKVIAALGSANANPVRNGTDIFELIE